MDVFTKDGSSGKPFTLMSFNKVLAYPVPCPLLAATLIVPAPMTPSVNANTFSREVFSPSSILNIESGNIQSYDSAYFSSATDNSNSSPIVHMYGSSRLTVIKSGCPGISSSEFEQEKNIDIPIDKNIVLNINFIITIFSFGIFNYSFIFSIVHDFYSYCSYTLDINVWVE